MAHKRFTPEEIIGKQVLANVSCWHIPAGFRLADSRPLSGVELPLDARAAAIRHEARMLQASDRPA